MGKAINLRNRVSSYVRLKAKGSSAYLGKRANLGPKTSLLVAHIASIEHINVLSELEALLLEANLIKKYEPPYNVRWTDGKAYPFIKITSKDTFPAVLQTRRMDDPKAQFYGPFPNIGDVRAILKSVRRIFPYQSVRNHAKRHCLYFHLGLCPCPVLLSKEELTKYRRSIRYLSQFLEGKKDSVIVDLTKQMKEAAKKEDFEEAHVIKKQLDTLSIITQQMYKPAAYIDNPNLVSDVAEKNIASLATVLQEKGVHIGRLSRIECYDISNISGKEATGSMVVATNGQIDKSQYRRFKIRFKDTPDDIFMHKEMLSRRLKHSEWQFPNLIVIDGGIAQANAATSVVIEYKLAIPVIGLAKRLEEIILPNVVSTPQSQFSKKVASKGEALRGRILLPRNHRALQLLQRLRDEAHRFAITYHRKLRRKSLLGS